MVGSNDWQNVIYDADPQTALLMVHVQRADVHTLLQESHKRKRDADPQGTDAELSDGDVALQLFGEELRAFRGILPDHNYAAAIGALPHGQEDLPQAVRASTPAGHTCAAPALPQVRPLTQTGPAQPDELTRLTPAIQPVHQALQDEVALSTRLDQATQAGIGRPAVHSHTPSTIDVPSSQHSGAAHPELKNEPAPLVSAADLPQQPPAAHAPDNAEETPVNLRSGHVEQVRNALQQCCSTANVVNDRSDASGQDSSEPQLLAVSPLKNERVMCVGCADEKSPEDVFVTPCDHTYCSECLDRQHSACMLDERLFPPRCCRLEIRWEAVRDRLSQQVRTKFEAKRVELQTKDRTYCHRPSCSAFIPPLALVGRQARCPNCGLTTCVDCKAAYHFGACAEDPHMAALLQTAEQNQWRRCSTCHRMIELTIGCYHITCICRAQFCYLCGLKWKTCRCPRWDEQRLIQRAQAAIERRQAAAPVQQQDQLQQVLAEVAQQMRRRPCTHTTIGLTERLGQMLYCGYCGILKRDWMNQCSDCGVQLCNTCRAGLEYDDDDDDECEHPSYDVVEEHGRTFTCEDCGIVKWNWMNVCNDCDAQFCNACCDDN